MARAAPGDRPRVAVIVLVCDDYAERYLADCYAGLSRQTYPADQIRLLVVNNGGAATSRQLIARLAPAAEQLVMARNLGWAGGNNAAIRLALAEDAAYVVLLNVDTTVDPEWLSQLVDAAMAHPELHILQSTLLLHGTNRLNSRGNRIHYLGYGFCGGYGEPEDAAGAPPGPVDFASGAAMLVKREVFDAVGLFRDDYVAYYDDLEFCWRSRLAGFNVGLARGSRCYHKYAPRTSPERLYLRERNRLLTWLTLPRRRTILVTAPGLMASLAVTALYALMRGWGGVVARLARGFLRADTWRSIRRHRQAVEALRVRPDAAIVRGFAGRLAVPGFNPAWLRYLVNPAFQFYWACVRRLIIW